MSSVIKGGASFSFTILLEGMGSINFFVIAGAEGLWFNFFSVISVD